MPYTPPSQRSPASSTTNSPAISRNQSYSKDLSNGHSTVPTRPALPRSLSSTSYLNKHRRTPSLADKGGEQPSPTDGAGAGSSRDTSANGSVQQAPAPVNSSLMMPPGAITTPPDSAHGSDDEDRGRRLGSLADLKQALQSIEVKRGGSPVRNGNGDGAPGVREPTSTPSAPARALTPEARKISHSRSSSEIQLSSLAKNSSPSPEQTSEDSDVEDDELRIKPPLLRKKSGELVKPALRPSSRRRPSSMPGTPTFSKAVHFNEDIEQVRHFLQVDKPIAVSAGSSPVETYDSESEYPFYHDDGGYSKRKVEWELRLANFPRETLERRALPVRVERIFMSSDKKTLVGTVAVANLAFHKSVVARFTLDYWKTTSEVAAEYNNDVRKKQAGDGCDRFNFNIKLADLANLESKTMLLCVRYSVGGQEYWDNNAAMNYQVDFLKKQKAKESKGAKQGSLGGPLVGSIPRSKHSPNSSRPRSFPNAFDDDFGSGFDSKYEFGTTGRPFFAESSNAPIRLKPKARARQGVLSDDAPVKTQPGGQAFATRYDFGASLSAALTNAQNALGERSGLKVDTGAPKVTAPRPDSISSEKPDVKSAEYNELIQKFCFVRAPRPGMAA